LCDDATKPNAVSVECKRNRSEEFAAARGEWRYPRAGPRSRANREAPAVTVSLRIPPFVGFLADNRRSGHVTGHPERTQAIACRHRWCSRKQ
jgi:hypothetical protein